MSGSIFFKQVTVTETNRKATQTVNNTIHYKGINYKWLLLKKKQIKRKNGCFLFIHTQVCVVGFFPLQNEKINWVKMGKKFSNLILKKNLKNAKVLHPDSRSALLNTQPSQVLEHMHPGSQTHTLSPTYILLCLVTQNGSCKIWWAVSKASLKDLKAEESRKGKENKWQLQNICLDAVLCF